MKKLLFIIAAVCMTISATVSAQAFREGVNYQVVRLQPTEKPQVLEFFSLLCPHCEQFEPIIEDLEKQLPNTEFKRVHVPFVGGPIGGKMVRAYAVMRVLGVQSRLVPIFFDDIHVQHLPVQTRADIRRLFVKAGIPGDKFDSAVDSFAVEGLVAQMEKTTRDYKIQGVPTVIVNGKYKVDPSSISSVKEYIQLVKYLVQKKD